MTSQHVSPGRRWRRGTTVLAACAVLGTGGVAAAAHLGPASAGPTGSAASAGGTDQAPAAAPPRLAAARSSDEGEGTSGVTRVFGHAETVTRLDPELLDALRRAATAAEQDGVGFVVDSGWRSAADQQRLLDDAVVTYGSLAAAQRWVATPETSQHVRGEAVDLGPVTARTWLERHGAAYGLCRTYANESWHYELRTSAVRNGCPAPYADAAHDPRMQR